MSSIYEQIQNWASAGGGEGDPVEDEATISAHLDGLISDYMTLHTDELSLPSDAEERTNQGPFFSLADLFEYLAGGRLLIEDGAGNPIVNPLVHVVKHYSQPFESDIIDVYIADDY